MIKSGNVKKTKKLISWIGWIISVLIIVVFVLGILNYSFLKETIGSEIANYGLIGVIIVCFILELFPQPFSAHAVLVSAGLLNINLFALTIGVIFVAFVASIIGFFIGRKFEKEFIFDLVGKKNSEIIKKGINRNGKWYVFISAISPLPYIPLIFGGLGMSWERFVVYGLIPRLFGFVVTALFVKIFII